MSILGASNGHRWRFFRAGGFDQVRLDSGADLVHLGELDQKLWVALACPAKGLEFDGRTLEMIDTDHDGRIRAPEIIAATKWTCSMFKNPDELLKGGAALPLSAINEATPEGKQLFASARQILINLGKSSDGNATISAEDTADTAKIFAQTRFNGDGIIPPDASDDPTMQAIINDVIACLGAETDRSGKPGINKAKLDLFFDNAVAFASWNEKSGAESTLPLGANTAAGASAIKAVAAKVEDYFARCRLASFDPRAVAAVNMPDEQYLAVAGKSLSLAGAEFAGFPLARVEANRPLPLVEGVNPGWKAAIEALRTQVIKPLLGDKTSLTETEWSSLVAKFAPFDAWLAAKAGTAVEKLGLPRVREILGTDSGEKAKAALAELIAKDDSLKPEADAIAAVDRLVHYHRDLYKLLNNFVAFRDFYSRRDKAVFQVGTLYLDQRSCELCVRVEDVGKHGAMAHLSYAYLAYCDLTRKATGEKMLVAAAFTAGDSDNLIVGRNGIFYDRLGRDWDATITKIVDNPISIRQAFWAPYKRFIRWIEDQVAKRAAAADAASQQRLTDSAGHVEATATTQQAAAPPKKLDVGVVAAMGVAFAALSTVMAALLNWLAGTPPYYIPLYVIALMLLISLPSMILAAIKLRQRNLGPILDANGWAVNARAKMNIPFGGSLTHIPKLPPGSHRDMVDPFAESHAARNRMIAVVVLILALLGCWYFGLFEKLMPDVLPKSSWVEHREQAATQRAAKEADERAATQRAASQRAASTPG